MPVPPLALKLMLGEGASVLLASQRILPTRTLDPRISVQVHRDRRRAPGPGRLSAMADTDCPLRYGINPHQQPATASAIGEWPFEVLNGQPGYINLLDAMSSPGASSANCGQRWASRPLRRSSTSRRPGRRLVCRSPSVWPARMRWSSYLELSPVAAAYVRARGGDLVSAYGDFAAVSDTVDASLARFLRREVSDGIIAPGLRTRGAGHPGQEEGRTLPGSAGRSQLGAAGRRNARPLRHPPGAAARQQDD